MATPEPLLCEKCGKQSLCGYIRLDDQEKPHRYCCQCVPTEMVGVALNPLVEKRTCEVKHGSCCYSILRYLKQKE